MKGKKKKSHSVSSEKIHEKWSDLKYFQRIYCAVIFITRNIKGSSLDKKKMIHMETWIYSQKFRTV